MKKYKSLVRSAVYFMDLDGCLLTIRFQDKGEPYCYGTYTTRDKRVMDFIESLPEFGDYITILEDIKEEEEAPAEVHWEHVFEDVKRTQEANKILVNEFGVDKEKLTSKADAIRIATELSISFPNL